MTSYSTPSQLFCSLSLSLLSNPPFQRLGAAISMCAAALRCVCVSGAANLPFCRTLASVVAGQLHARGTDRTERAERKHASRLPKVGLHSAPVGLREVKKKGGLGKCKVHRTHVASRRDRTVCMCALLLLLLLLQVYGAAEGGGSGVLPLRSSEITHGHLILLAASLILPPSLPPASKPCRAI